MSTITVGGMPGFDVGSAFNLGGLSKTLKAKIGGPFNFYTQKFPREWAMLAVKTYAVADRAWAAF